jgi:eukaryotic translation initiation factor 2C
LVGSGTEKRGVVMAVWKSNQVQTKLRNSLNGQILWNGDKIAWSSAKVDEIRILVDMDQERGRTPQPGRPANTFRFGLKHSKVINLAVLNAFLTHKHPFDDTCLESISESFLIHFEFI